MKFSIITVCYNSETTIRRTFNSVLAQEYDDYEYIIIDGASKDGTVGIIKEYEPKFNGRMNWISEKDHGIFEAMNKGLKMASGDWIGIINSDDWFEPSALENVRKYMDTQPDVIYGTVRNHMNNGAVELIRTDPRNLEQKAVQHPGCFISKSAYEKFGAYDLNFPLAADYELLLRFYIHGAVFQPMDEIVANFTFDGVSNKKIFKAEMQIIKLMRQHKRIGVFKVVLYYLRTIFKTVVRRIK